jgi:hypothetical protein
MFPSVRTAVGKGAATAFDVIEPKILSAANVVGTAGRKVGKAIKEAVNKARPPPPPKAKTFGEKLWSNFAGTE